MSSARRDDRPLKVIVTIHEPSELRRLRDQKRPLSGPIAAAVDGGVGEQWVGHRGTGLVRVYY